MQESDVPWERSALILGVLLTLVTLVSKVWLFPFRWIGRQVGRLLMWSGREAILLLLKSDATRWRGQIAVLFADELEANRQARAMLDTLDRTCEARNRETRRQVGTLEDAIVKLEEAAIAERQELRSDMTVLYERVTNAAHRLSQRVEQESRETRELIQAQSRTLHTLTALIAGPDEVRAALRKQIYGDPEGQ